MHWFPVTPFATAGGNGFCDGGPNCCPSTAFNSVAGSTEQGSTGAALPLAILHVIGVMQINIAASISERTVCTFPSADMN